MQGKPPQELNPTEGNGFFGSPVAVVFGDENNIAISNVQNPLVGNGYPVGVLPQVPDNMFISPSQGEVAARKECGG